MKTAGGHRGGASLARGRTRGGRPGRTEFPQAGRGYEPIICYECPSGGGWVANRVAAQGVIRSSQALPGIREAATFDSCARQGLDSGVR